MRKLIIILFIVSFAGTASAYFGGARFSDGEFGLDRFGDGSSGTTPAAGSGDYIVDASNNWIVDASGNAITN